MDRSENAMRFAEPPNGSSEPRPPSVAGFGTAGLRAHKVGNRHAIAEADPRPTCEKDEELPALRSGNGARTPEPA